MKKMIKEMTIDFISPVITSTNTAALAPFTALVRIEALTSKVLNGINTVTGKSRAKKTALLAKQQTVDTIPLIKASTLVAVKKHAHLAGQSVLCIGGRKQLYPAYRQIIEDTGGYFLSFHGSTEMPVKNLLPLLEQADMVICPIDCVRHEVFLVTKQFCKRFNKPCVLLDKSRVTTFYNGVRMLSNLQ